MGELTTIMADNHLSPGPAESNCEDMMHLLKMFPNEVWQLIFDNVPDPQICYNASPGFRQLLQHRRIFFFFPKVWDSLADYRKRMNKKEKENSANTPEGRITTHVEKDAKVDKGVRKIVKLRLVCKDWKGIIDNYLEAKFLHGGRKAEEFGKVIEKVIKPKRNFVLDDCWTTKFMTKFVRYKILRRVPGTPPINPFLSKSLQLHFVFPQGTRPDLFIMNNNNNYNYNFCRNLSKIFESYGHTLNKFTFHFGDNMLAHPVCYLEARIYLSLMDNLQMLKLSNIGNRQSNSILGELADYVTEFPMRPLQKLRYLSLHNVPRLVFDQLIRINRQITRLGLSRCSDGERYELSSLQLPNLKHLRIRLLSKDELRQLLRANLSPVFERLDLFMSVVMCPYKLFKLLGKKWGNTLTRIFVQFDLRSGEVEPRMRLKLDKLKSVKTKTMRQKTFPRLVKKKFKINYIETDVGINL